MREVSRLRYGAWLVAILGSLASAVYAVEPNPKVLAAVTGVPVTEQRVALVIGNSQYKYAPLQNPENDAADIASALRTLNFKVTLKLNQNREGMALAIREFGRKLRQGGTGLFYYAGHGMQVKGKNFLIPVDADIQEEDEIPFRSIDANEILAKMESARNRINIMILDACRNNPFARSFRSGSQGLAQMDAPVGTLIAFATAPGSVAADGAGRNGLYTQHLLAAMQEPGLKIEDIFKRVRQGVRSGSGDRQIPWENTSLEGDFYFRIAKAPSAALATPSPTVQVAKAAPVLVEKISKKIILLVRGYPESDGEWDRETETSYSQKAAGLVGRDLVKIGGSAIKLETIIDEKRADPILKEVEGHARSQQLCLETQSDVLVSVRIESENHGGTTASANWPNAFLSIYDCADKRIYTESKRLTPSNRDAFAFSDDLGVVANAFLRTYRYLYQPR